MNWLKSAVVARVFGLQCGASLKSIDGYGPDVIGTVQPVRWAGASAMNGVIDSMKASTRTSVNKRSQALLARLLLLAAALDATTPVAQAQARDAKTVLKAMSDYLSSQKTIEHTLDSDIEVITPQMEKIQFTNSGEALLSRPDKLRTHRVGGYDEVALFFNGKTVSVFAKHANGYTQFDAPDSVDQLIAALRSGDGVALPGADLLLSNSDDVLVAGVMEAKHIGRGVIDGRALIAEAAPNTREHLWTGPPASSRQRSSPFRRATK